LGQLLSVAGIWTTYDVAVVADIEQSFAITKPGTASDKFV
jgi:hypothetical protein